MTGRPVRRPHRAKSAAAAGAVVAALCLGSVLPASAATLRPVAPGGPGLGGGSGVVADRGTARVVVTLRDAPDLRGVAALGRAQRLSTVVRRLRAHADTAQAPLRRRLRALEATGEVTAPTPLWVANAVSVTATPRALRELAARPDVASVTPDAITVVPTALPVEPNIAALRAPDLWDTGQTGQGVVVATLDTGVDLTNPDLAARWRGGTNSWYDPYGQHPAGPVDLSGHGTASAGLAVGGSEGGSSYGMAPGATLIAARVFDDRGATTATAMHLAFQWLLDPDHDPATADAPRVVNASWALGAGPSCNLAFQPDVRALRAAGILPVFSAGNFGPTAGTSASPANYPESLSVGAVGSTDAIWAYSSAGPSTCGGRTRVFPDLVAPGVSVLSADLFGGFQYLSGTSIAAPHVAGAAALLLGAHPTLSAAGVESALTGGAVDLGPAGPDERYGNGRLDVMAADARAATAPPDFTVSAATPTMTTMAGGSASTGLTLTPANGFADPTSLSVQGLPAGASATLTPTVLGPGAWTSTLVVTTTGAVAPGSHPFTITASGGGLTRSVAATLVVTAADFSITASPSRLPVARGRSASTTIVVRAGGALAAPVALSTPSLLPVGVSVAWTGNPVTAPGSATLRFSVTSRVRKGTYPVVVTGSSGGRTRTVTVSLLVR